MSTLTSKARKAVAGSTLPSNSPQATVNRAGGVAFEITDPFTKLLTMTGGSFFAEPRFYNADSCIPKRLAGGKFEKLTQRVEIADGKLKGFVKSDELDDVAREVLATAIDVANGNHPEDLLILANWLRNEVNIRLTPQVLLMLASRLPNTQGMVRRYASKVIVRPDEVRTIMLLHRYFFGFKTMKNSLALSLADAVHRFGERALLKYEGDGWPTWKDVLCTLPRKKGWPVTDEVAKFFITGQVVDAVKTPVIAARAALAKCKTFDDEARDLARRSMVNWEVLLSQFPNDKKAVWEFLVDEKLLGYMAMLRNLRNLVQVGIGEATLTKVSLMISDAAEVAKSRQLPFRFMAAHSAMESARGGSSVDYSELMAAIELAINAAADNVTALPGTTVVFADDSGSMTTNKVSEKSEMTLRDAAMALAGIVAKRGERVYLNAFSSEVKEIRFSRNDTVMHIISRMPRTGDSTYGHKCVEWLMAQDFAPDRVIVMSDAQCYNDSSGGPWGTPTSESMCDLWKKYAKSAKGKKAWLHSIHLGGYGDTPVDPDAPRVNLVGGFSEKILDSLLRTEGVLGGTAVPTMEQLREKWSVK